MGYVELVREWQAKMDAELRGDGSWASYVGEYWLKNGINTLGSSADCDIRLPKEAPHVLGAIRMAGTSAVFEADVGQNVEVNGYPVRMPAPLRWDSEKASHINFKCLRIVMVQGEGRVGLRVWDDARAHELPPRSWFDINEKYAVKGSYAPYPIPAKVELPNAEGKTESGYVPGYVSFRLEGKSCSLDASEMPDGRLHIQFGDMTNGTGTFPGGRYLETEPMQEDGHVEMDFNKAYNPPCAFRAGAACTLALAQNHLKVRVEAGERWREGRQGETH